MLRDDLGASRLILPAVSQSTLEETTAAGRVAADGRPSRPVCVGPNRTRLRHPFDEVRTFTHEYLFQIVLGG